MCQHGVACRSDPSKLSPDNEQILASTRSVVWPPVGRGTVKEGKATGVKRLKVRRLLLSEQSEKTAWKRWHLSRNRRKPEREPWDYLGKSNPYEGHLQCRVLRRALAGGAEWVMRGREPCDLPGWGQIMGA